MASRVVPERVTAVSAAAVALTVRLAPVYSGAGPMITAVAPPAADPVPLHSAAGCSVHRGEHAVVARRGVHGLGRSGLGVAGSTTSTATGAGPAASSHPVCRGLL